MLREKHGCHCTVLHGQHKSDIPQTAELEAADCFVLYIRRLALPTEQLARVREYLKSGQTVHRPADVESCFLDEIQDPQGLQAGAGHG